MKLDTREYSFWSLGHNGDNFNDSQHKIPCFLFMSFELVQEYSDVDGIEHCTCFRLLLDCRMPMSHCCDDEQVGNKHLKGMGVTAD